jgi:outer membrane protein assembly factor BamE (lipoprotein component of BamABCDE complex)
VTDRRVIAITFDQNDVVASVNRYGLEDGRVVDLETRTTPTYGQQLTIIQQILGNVGSLENSVFDENDESRGVD